MKLKKVVTLLSIVAITLSLVACNGNNASGNNTSKPTVTYSKGTLTENTFESEYLNLKFTAPDGYIMATEDELIPLMELGAEVLEKDKKSIDFAMANTVFEMMVSSPAGSPNLSLAVEKLALKNMTTDQYIEAIKKQLEGNDTMEVTFTPDSKTMSIAGEDYTAYSSVLSVSGMELKQDYIMRKMDDRLAYFVLTYTEDSSAEANTLMESFTNLK